MFSNEQPDVITDEDVGDYIEQLQRESVDEINHNILGLYDGLEEPSNRLTNRTQDKS